jgi:acyl-coenzyme A synthetase/AMP-(fatty) acid ligase
LELAQEVEAQLKTPMVEIYGSTETGALATRQPTQGAQWETYAGITLQQDQAEASAHAAHFEAPQILGDVLDLHSPTRFHLLGRNSDMINIVGKRSSLAYLNQLLLKLPGVQDCAFCMHGGDHADGVPRLMAFVVAPTLTAAAILASLRGHVDPVFLPRPLVFLNALGRDANGKLSAATLADLRAQHLAAGA